MSNQRALIVSVCPDPVFYRLAEVDVAGELGDGVTWSSGMLGSPAFIYIGADPALVEHVLKTAFWKYEKGTWFRDTMRVFLGDGIFNVDGKEWQRQRKGQIGHTQSPGLAIGTSVHASLLVAHFSSFLSRDSCLLVASHMFTARNLKEDMSAVFIKNAHLLLARMRQHAHAQRTFDIQVSDKLREMLQHNLKHLQSALKTIVTHRSQ